MFFLSIDKMYNFKWKSLKATVFQFRLKVNIYFMNYPERLSIYSFTMFMGQYSLFGYFDASKKHFIFWVTFGGKICRFVIIVLDETTNLLESVTNSNGTLQAIYSMIIHGFY